MPPVAVVTPAPGRLFKRPFESREFSSQAARGDFRFSLTYLRKGAEDVRRIEIDRGSARGPVSALLDKLRLAVLL